MISAEAPKVVETRTVQKWGNGLGVLLPKSMVKSFGLNKGDILNFSLEGQQVTINNVKEEPLVIPEFKLEDLLAGYEGYTNNLEWPEIQLVGAEI